MVLFWSRCCQNRSLTFDIYHQPLSNVHSVRATTTEKDPASWNFNPKVIRANTIWYKVTLKPCFKFSDTVWRSNFPSDLTLDIFPQTKGDAFMDIFITLRQKNQLRMKRDYELEKKMYIFIWMIGVKTSVWAHLFKRSCRPPCTFHFKTVQLPTPCHVHNLYESFSFDFTCSVLPVSTTLRFWLVLIPMTIPKVSSRCRVGLVTC